MLERLLESVTHLDALTWREFEELIADLLDKDGYTVTLGPGTKDGGKDITATKQLEEVGQFMSVWQVKKLTPGNKVELSVIRELADTRTQHKASKGMIVTTTYLTRGALERVQQDQYLLGKVDRDDLMQWIRRVK
jgi:restriction system protein